MRRFEVEAQTVARLEHPHIVPLYDYWRDPSGAYLVMRYLAGGSAEQRLVQRGPWSLDDVARFVDEIGAALAVAHDAGVLHRDVKPANVLFDEVGNSYLADFGIAAEVGTMQVADLRSAGSPLYVSPEQVRDGESSPASDIYAFGVVLYELLTGGPPFADADSVQALLDRKVRERVPSIANDRPDIPAAIDLVVQTATAADPQQRFPSMGEMVLAFRGRCIGSCRWGGDHWRCRVGTVDPRLEARPNPHRPRAGGWPTPTRACRPSTRPTAPTSMAAPRLPMSCLAASMGRGSWWSPARQGRASRRSCGLVCCPGCGRRAPSWLRSCQDCTPWTSWRRLS